MKIKTIEIIDELRIVITEYAESNEIEYVIFLGYVLTCSFWYHRYNKTYKLEFDDCGIETESIKKALLLAIYPESISKKYDVIPLICYWELLPIVMPLVPHETIKDNHTQHNSIIKRAIYANKIEQLTEEKIIEKIWKQNQLKKLYY